MKNKNMYHEVTLQTSVSFIYTFCIPKKGVIMQNFKYFIGIDIRKDSFVASCKFLFENRKFNMDKEGFCLTDNVLKNFKKESIYWY